MDELRLVEGFDAALVEVLRALRHRLPLRAGCGRGCGVNPNTAPPHVLALIFYNDGVDLRLASEDVVRRILEVREEGAASARRAKVPTSCTPISEIVTNADLSRRRPSARTSSW